MQNDNTQKHKRNNAGKRSSIFFAVILIILGVVFLLNKVLDMQFGVWDIVWPAALLCLGIMWLVERFSPFALGVAVLGAYCLLRNLGVYLPALSWGVIWPIGVVLIGLTILYETVFAKKRHHPYEGKEQKTFTAEDGGAVMHVAFAQDNRKLTGVFHGAEVHVSFGSATLDLTAAQMENEVQIVYTETSFGSFDLWIPRDVAVRNEIKATCGAVEVHGSPSSDAQKTIRLHGTVRFGSVEVRYR